MVFKSEQFCLLGTFGKVSSTALFFHGGEEGATGIQWAEARDAAELSTMVSDNPHKMPTMQRFINPVLNFTKSTSDCRLPSSKILECEHLTAVLSYLILPTLLFLLHTVGCGSQNLPSRIYLSGLSFHCNRQIFCDN